ncbi:unnamed protein product [Gordionus sp. m RMFG-2023]
MPLKDKTAKSSKFLYSLLCTYGRAKKIQINDQGREFVNEVSTNYHKLVGTMQWVTSVYHPQANGMVERVNRTIQNALLKCIEDDYLVWTDALPGILFAYNTSCHDTSKFTPFELMYGRKAIQAYGNDEENYIDPDNVEEIDREKHFQSIVSKMQDIHNIAMGNINLAQLKQQRDYRTRHTGKNAPYKINDKVLIWNSRRADRKGGKMTRPWLGPFTIVWIVKNDEENFQEQAIKNVKLNSEENHMKGAPPSNLKIVDGEVDKLNRNEDEIILETVVSKKDVKNLFIPTNRNWKIYHSLRYNWDIKKRYPKFKNGIMSENFSTERIIGDGNCLFRCISKEICEDECHYHFLRSECARFMKSKDVAEQMEGFLGEPVDAYLERTGMAQNAVYELQILNTT